MPRRSVLKGLFFALGAGLAGLCRMEPVEAAPEAKAASGPSGDRDAELVYNGVPVRLCRPNSFHQSHEVAEDGLTLTRYTVDVSGVVQLKPGQTADQVRDALTVPRRAALFLMLGRPLFETADVRPDSAQVLDVHGERTAFVRWTGSAVVRERRFAAV